MNKTFKKALSLILAIMLTFSVASFAFAAGELTEEISKVEAEEIALKYLSFKNQTSIVYDDVYNYTDAYGNPAVETYYPCVAQLQYGQATPLNPRVCGDVVLKRKAGAKSAANPAVGKAAAKSVASLGEAPQPLQRTFSVTPLVVDEAKVAKPIIRKTPYDNSPEAYHARVRALFKKMYGVDFPAKQ